jgi:hypothetical protein
VSEDTAIFKRKSIGHALSLIVGNTLKQSTADSKHNKMANIFCLACKREIKMRLILITTLLLFAQVGQAFEQVTYFKASNTDSRDIFGTSVAISRDTMVIGAWGESSNAVGINGDQSNNSFEAAGAVYIFVRTGGIWTQQAYLKVSNTGTDDRFGQAVAISGDTIVVGAFFEDSIATGVNGNQTNDHAEDSGAVYVFTRT